MRPKSGTDRVQLVHIHDLLCECVTERKRYMGQIATNPCFLRYFLLHGQGSD